MLHLYKKAEALKQLNNIQLSHPAEQNIFNHPAFLYSALEYLASDSCQLLTLENPQTCFLMPVQVARVGLGLRKTIYGWSNLYATQGTPLIGDKNTAQTLEQVLTELARPQHGFPDTLLLPDINLNGDFAQILTTITQQQKLPLQIVRQVERPVLHAHPDPENYLNQAIDKNHRRNHHRLWRRLAETGSLSCSIASGSDDVARTFETFLKLEAAGWKGKCGTAFLNKQSDTDFARKAINGLTALNMVRIHTLMLDDKPLACLVVFITGDQAWTWKTAYDERYRAYSPGVLLMIEVLKTQLENPALRITDSCALPDHPVMSRLFHERESFGTMIIGLSDHSQPSVRQIARQLETYDRFRYSLRNLKSRISKFGKI